jgi:hypothetical protein
MRIFSVTRFLTKGAIHKNNNQLLILDNKLLGLILLAAERRK